jgi:hypothetical protein
MKSLVCPDELEEIIEAVNKLPQLAHAEVGVFSSPRLSNKFS